MSKYAKSARTARPAGVTNTLPADPLRPVRTHEGGQGHALDVKTELFTLATTSFLSGDSFYESGGKRDDRFVRLCQEATAADPQWMAAFIPWLRNEANMRTASVVAAVEFARVFSTMVKSPNHPVSPRRVLSSALQRADEPAEALAYHLAMYGKPKAYSIKRGIGDAASRLYTEFSLNKYDPKGAAVRPRDVIELCHPVPQAPWQSALFKYVLDQGHGHFDGTIPEELGGITQYELWKCKPTLDTIPALVTWENLSSHFPMDAKAWAAVIPRMGYMALLRNLRNFEQAGVPDHILNRVAAKLTDPEEVAKSRQLPFRFYSAYTNLHTDRFKFDLGRALDLSCSNVPQLPGHTLVMIDVSGSMASVGYDGKSRIRPVEQAAVFGSVVHNRMASVATYGFDDRLHRYTQSMTGSVLGNVANIVREARGGATYTWPCLAEALAQESRMHKRVDRVFIFTDMQSHPANSQVDSMLPRSTPVHVWDLKGYGQANLELGSGRYLHAGLSDQSFKVVKLLEEYQPGRWPWEA